MFSSIRAMGAPGTKYVNNPIYFVMTSLSETSQRVYSRATTITFERGDFREAIHEHQEGVFGHRGHLCSIHGGDAGYGHAACRHVSGFGQR